jgi:hypothetical protein
MLSRNFSPKRALAAAVAGTACAALTLTALPADAAAPASAESSFRLAPRQKIGPVQNLALSLTKPGDNYRAHVTWDALASATAYKVTLTGGSTTVTSPKITATTWDSEVSGLAADDQVTASVVPYAGKRPGKATSVSTAAADLDAPTGSFELVFDEGTLTATVTELDVADNVTADANIVREVDWGTGVFEGWTPGSPATHTYPGTIEAYHPKVRLTDAATTPNSAEIELTTVVVNDGAAPIGSYTVTPASGWAKYTRVTLTETDLSDDASDDADITRVVDWGDGSSGAWTSGVTLTHVYQGAGSFTPSVALTDEAARSADGAVLDGPVVVKADTVKPTVKLVKPRKRVRSEVSSWVRMHGRAADRLGSGVQSVSLRLVEKRNGAWFGYKATTKKWVQAASKAGAVRKSRAASLRPVAGKWNYRVRGLRKGLLVVTVGAKDNVGNAANPVVYKQLLTRR